jgi:hypothetical protein
MFACSLLSGMGLALTFGLLDAFVTHAGAIQRQGSVSAGSTWPWGLPLLIIGIATDWPLTRPAPTARPGHGRAAGAEEGRPEGDRSTAGRCEITFGKRTRPTRHE